jgi:EmrB/QacA subfamily drug resistance transporter
MDQAQSPEISLNPVAPRRTVVVLAVMLAMFMAAMEATVIGTAMPTVVAELHGIELYGWVGAIYMLATTVTIPVYGKLADTFGRKPTMLVGIALFLLGSCASGAAPTMTLLIAARALQGIGAGGIQPVALTIVGDVFTPAERARIQGLFGAVWGVAGISGPLLGGLIVKLLSWRWVFFVNVPFGALAAALLVFGYRETHREAQSRKLDVVGAVLLTVSILALLAGASGKQSAMTLPVAVVALVLFVFVERKHPSPLLPLDLLRRPLIAVSSAAGAVVGGVMTAAILYVPLYVQAILGGSPTDGGTVIAPMLIGWPVASALSGRLLLKVGTRPLVRVGFGLVAVASVMLDLATMSNLGPNALRASMLIFGAGMGLANTALVIAVQESVDGAQRGVATASTMFFRTIGGALMVGVLGAALALAVSGRIPENVLQAILGPEHGRGLSREALASCSEALRRGMTPIFHSLAAMGIIGGVIGLFYPQSKLGRS